MCPFDALVTPIIVAGGKKVADKIGTMISDYTFKMIDKYIMPKWETANEYWADNNVELGSLDFSQEITQLANTTSLFKAQGLDCHQKINDSEKGKIVAHIEFTYKKKLIEKSFNFQNNLLAKLEELPNLELDENEKNKKEKAYKLMIVSKLNHIHALFIIPEISQSIDEIINFIAAKETGITAIFNNKKVKGYRKNTQDNLHKHEAQIFRTLDFIDLTEQIEINHRENLLEAERYYQAKIDKINNPIKKKEKVE